MPGLFISNTECIGMSLHMLYIGWTILPSLSSRTSWPSIMKKPSIVFYSVPILVLLFFSTVRLNIELNGSEFSLFIPRAGENILAFEALFTLLVVRLLLLAELLSRASCNRLFGMFPFFVEFLKIGSI